MTNYTTYLVLFSIKIGDTLYHGSMNGQTDKFSVAMTLAAQLRRCGCTAQIDTITRGFNVEDR